MPAPGAALLAQAREADADGVWQAIEQMLADARQRFAAHPWVFEVLEQMAAPARSMDTQVRADQSPRPDTQLAYVRHLRIIAR